MKKKLLILICLVFSLFSSVAFLGCNGQDFTIEFETFGANQIQSITASAGTTIEIPDAVWPNYTFLGWYEDEDFNTPFQPITQMPSFNLKLYAKFTPENRFLITFNSLGGSQVPSVYKVAGESLLDLQEPTRYGYLFTGWYADSDLTNPITQSSTATQNTVLYAKWSEDPAFARVKFFANDVLVDETMILSDTYLTKPTLFSGLQYTATQWQTSSGANFNFTTQKVTQNLSLYIYYHSSALVFDSSDPTIIKGYTGTIQNAEVVLPLDATQIAPKAFQNKTTIKSITAYQNLTQIGEYAFSGCTNLVSFSSAQSVTQIGEYAFNKCSKLTDIDISSVQQINNSTFSGCALLKTITFSDNLTSIGVDAFSGCKVLAEVNLGQNLQAIGDNAFKDCAALKTFEIPTSLASLGLNVFDGAKSLASITVAAGNTAFLQESDGVIYNSAKTRLIFYNQTGKTTSEFTIPNTVEVVDKTAFASNNNLTHITIPASVENALGILSECQSLNTLTLENMDEIGYLAYLYGASSYAVNGKNSASVSSKLKIVNFTSITTLPHYAFYGCSFIEAINGLQNLISIGNYAFAYTGFDGDFVIGKDLTSIGNGAFAGSKITGFDIDSQNTVFEGTDYLYDTVTDTLLKVFPSVSEFDFAALIGVQKIGDYAFEGCILLNDISIPLSVITIGDGAFNGCTALKTLIMPLHSSILNDDRQFDILFGGTVVVLDKLTLISETVGAVIPNAAFNFFAIKEVVLPSTVVKIGDLAFSDNYSLTKISGLTNVTQIGEAAFFNCTLLVDIDFGNKLESIGEQAFRDCDSLTTVVLPQTIKTISGAAFYSAGSLTSLTFTNAASSQLEYIGDIAFDGTHIVGELILPASLEYIGYGALRGQRITSLSFAGTPSAGLEIDEWAFSASNNLLSADFSNSALKDLSNYAFAYCHEITTVILPTGMTTIGNGVFNDCFELENITIPSTVTSVGHDILRNTKWYNQQTPLIENGILYKDHVALGYFGEIPENGTFVFETMANITVIASNFFLTGLRYEDGSEYPVGDHGYRYMDVKQVVIKAGYKYISPQAFLYCANLEKVTFGTSETESTIEKIEAYAFPALYKLNTVIFYQSTPPAFDQLYITESNKYIDTTFIYIEDITIYVPDGNVAAYEAAMGETEAVVKNISQML